MNGENIIVLALRYRWYFAVLALAFASIGLSSSKSDGWRWDQQLFAPFFAVGILCWLSNWVYAKPLQDIDAMTKPVMLTWRDVKWQIGSGVLVIFLCRMAENIFIVIRMHERLPLTIGFIIAVVVFVSIPVIVIGFLLRRDVKFSINDLFYQEKYRSLK